MSLGEKVFYPLWNSCLLLLKNLASKGGEINLKFNGALKIQKS